jgi:uncharacterized protein (TIGR02145 family)
MSCNYSINYPGSRVFADDEANRIPYGGLYTWNQVMTAGFVPTGWHVPTEAEWMVLINYLGGIGTAGGIMKDSGLTYWDAPNPVSTPISCFEARGGGYYHVASLLYYWLKEQGIFWAASELAGQGRYVQLSFDQVSVIVSSLVKTDFLSVRLIRDTPVGPGDVPYTGYGALYNWFSISVPVVMAAGYGALYNWHALNNILAGVGDGRLYNWYAATDARNIASYGWHVPTVTEVVTMYNSFGDWNSADELKEIGNTYWDPINGGTNSVGFNGRGGGFRNGTTGAFAWQKIAGRFIVASGGNYCFILEHDQTTISFGGQEKDGGSLRLVRDSTALGDGDTSTYVGNDGRTYNTICIGTQEWLSENLFETKYRNGESITEVTDNAAWAALSTGAMCWYNNIAGSAPMPLLPPIGWHLPTFTEFETLANYLGGASVAGGHMKEAGTTNWNSINAGADNSSGFTALGGGYRDDAGNFLQQLSYAYFWNAQSYNANDAYYSDINFSSPVFWTSIGGADYVLNKKYGCSVRLIKDDSVDPGAVSDIDGNIYQTVKIGNQVWMTSNFKSEHYNDGSNITIEPDAGAWAALSTEAMCYYV